MARSSYSMKPCGYCGRITGKNEGEHVIPRCLYTSLTPSNVQRLKISACPDCNDGFSVSEAHFRNIVAASGFTPSPARKELINATMRSFKDPKSGRGDLQKFWQQMVDAPLLKADGTPHKQVLPHTDAEVRFIARKVVRGLVHSLDWTTVIPDSHVAVRQFLIPPDDTATMMEDWYVVPDHFHSQYVMIDDRFEGEFRKEMHSVWQIKFYDLSLTCAVANRPVTL